jgi:hypothetical protein
LEVPGLLTGPNLTIAGTATLCLAGLLAGLALLLSSRPSKSAGGETASESPAPAAATVANAPMLAAAEIIPLLLRGSLPLDQEPIFFPRETRIYGRVVASARYRVDAAHGLREPHFPLPDPAETSQPAWDDAVWISVRTLDGSDGPHFARVPAVSEPRVMQPERSLS